MKLNRVDFLVTGIFGSLTNDDDSFAPAFSCQTLEHAYSKTDKIGNLLGFEPKIPNGSYECVRGFHHLEGMVMPFETFQVMNVPGHTGILFHSGNMNADSSGCILLGLKRVGSFEILESKLAFEGFMKSLEGINNFTLTITQYI